MGGVAGGIDPSFSESSMVIDYVRVYQNTGLSTNNVFANQFSVYPNPSNNAHTLNIRTTEQINKIVLLNTLGQQILSKTKNTNTLEILNIRSGIYLLKIYADNRLVTKRVIIK